jgi:hypothetical protein
MNNTSPTRFVIETLDCIECESALKVVDKLAEENLPCQLGIVDCTVSKELCKTHEIGSNPAIKLFR